MKSESNGLRTWIEIDRKAIAHNAKTFRSLLSKKTKLMAVVKSNAYGHSLIDFSKEMESKADWLGVDSVVEGIALRKSGNKLPILVLGHTLPERMADAKLNNLSVTISTEEMLRYIVTLKPIHQPRFHIKVDTGMHRQGFLPAELPRVVTILKSSFINPKSLSTAVEGLFTHFASAKNPAFPAYTKEQIKEFNVWRKAFEKAGLKFISHAAATGGALLFPESHFDMVRIGIGLYGYWPSLETQEFLKDKLTLKPILTWKTVLSEIKKLPKGSKIGYDCTETLSRDSTVAICPVGYWHGYSRRLSSIARVLVRGKHCRVLGRVSMDMLIIDMTGTGAKVGDEVILIGISVKESISAADMAGLDETSYYETLTRINPLIKRFYT